MYDWGGVANYPCFCPCAVAALNLMKTIVVDIIAKHSTIQEPSRKLKLEYSDSLSLGFDSSIRRLPKRLRFQAKWIAHQKHSQILRPANFSRPVKSCINFEYSLDTVKSPVTVKMPCCILMRIEEISAVFS